MHPASFQGMEQCYNRFIVGSPLESQNKVKILDIGGHKSTTAGYYPIFAKLTGKDTDYIGTDIYQRPGVSLVFKDPYKIPLRNSSVEIVISGQTFEHSEFFWLLFQEMVRVLKPGGFMFIIVPTEAPVHRFPVDCYRFNPDAFRALAKYAKCQMLDAWRNESQPWRDLIGVFRKEIKGPKPADLALLEEARAAARAHDFPQAIAKYLKSENEFGDDSAFLTEFMNVAVSCNNHWHAYRLASKLLEGFKTNASVPLILGRSVVKLGKPSPIRARAALYALQLARKWSKPLTLPALTWQILLGEHSKDPGLVQSALIEAVDLVIGGYEIEPGSRWAIPHLRRLLRKLGDNERLAALNSALKGPAERVAIAS